MTIAFLDLARLHATLASEFEAVFHDAVATSAFVGGAAVRVFEEAFAQAHGAPAAAGCGSGTDALALALRVLGLRSGDEVVVPAMTFVATAEAVVHAGGLPVIADVDPSTLLLTPGTVGKVLTPRTRAVVPVHLFGHTVDFDAIRGWRDAGLIVLEDAAQAHLATWNGEFVGTVGHAAAFSFYPGKNLGALGDGGLVLSVDPALVAGVRHARDHGRSTKYEHDAVGWCSRLDAMQAAFLSVKLAHLPEWTASRRRLAARYWAAIGEMLVPWEDGAVHHLLVMRVRDGRRAEMQQALAGAGIQTSIHYPVALCDQPAMKPWAGRCPDAAAAADEVLSLPMDPLMTDDEVDVVCRAVTAALNS